MQGRFFLGWAILMTALSLGCGGGGSTNRTVAAGELAVSPSTLDFGQVVVGANKGQTGTLTAGDSSITVTSADWHGDGYSISGIVFPLTIRAGQSVPFKITFAPSREGSSEGKITFQSNAEHEVKAAFKGKGAQTSGHRVTLAWRSASASTIGYNVYRAIASKGPYDKLNSALHPKSSFTDATVASGATYFYMTTAVNKNGRESKYSNQVRVTIPNS
jgi:hypothetical protein